MAFRAKAMLACSLLNDRKIFVLGFFSSTNEVQANLWLIDRKKLKTE